MIVAQSNLGCSKDQEVILHMENAIVSPLFYFKIIILEHEAGDHKVITLQLPYCCYESLH